MFAGTDSRIWGRPIIVENTLMPVCSNKSGNIMLENKSTLLLKKCTANYSYTNHNFVFQNIDGQRIDNEYLPAICILKNILQRGRPTLMSKWLQETLGSIHQEEDFEQPYPLIVPLEDYCPKWERIIRGDIKGNYFPAKKFFEDLIPWYLAQYVFIQQLLVPEIIVNDITQVVVDEFASQQVDFYLPQAYLIIEIDGSQHEETSRQDEVRDQHTAKYGIETIRIKVADLEAENDTFREQIGRIRERIERGILSQENDRRAEDPTFVSIKDYMSVFENGVDLTNPNYKASAIIRFQLLVLELLEMGCLKFDEEWRFEIRQQDVEGFAELALQDLNLWFEHLFKLHKVEWQAPEYNISFVDSVDEFSQANDSLKIDFSILRRYTDEPQTHPGVIYVRTDYLDEYRYFKMGSANRLEFAKFEPYDYFQVSTAEPVAYKFEFGEDNSDGDSLLFFIKNIFLQEVSNLSFKSGQLQIIANALSRRHTIGLLPTGSGKSVCYQLSAILQPAISFVVSPIKALMYDQKADLDKIYFSRVQHITSDDDYEDRDKIQDEFGKGLYLFIFISPERFQIAGFRQYISTVNRDFNIAYAVVDEVHCLSEWGHDFRTSYLSLSNAIRRFCHNFNFIGLTATASASVLKDIRVEFEIDEDDVMGLRDYTREELDFEVFNDYGNKYQKLTELLRSLHEENRVLIPDGPDSRCGIIFTPHVSGKKGCYQLAVNLSSSLSDISQTDIRYYSGSVPKIRRMEIMDESDFTELKNETQDEFKENGFTLLTATKAFGMGVNKPNIHYTIHYGLPSSMEALYQEGGRAGRDSERFSNENAQSFVLFSQSNRPQSTIDGLWRRDITLSNLKDIQEVVGGDLNTNLFMFTLNMDDLTDELGNINRLYETLSPNETSIRIEGRSLGLSKQQVEKVLYRLHQLGVVEDWTIEDFYEGGVFWVDCLDFTLEFIRESLVATINRYEEFSFQDIGTWARQDQSYHGILNDASDRYSEFDRYVLLLLQWTENTIVYRRRQSLKTIYENCCKVVSGDMTSEVFKTELENYFKFNQSSFVLQHIVENPRDFERWFEVFYPEEDQEGGRDDRFLTVRNQEALRSSLSRFLESYRSNLGLDMISGLLRLLLDDYDNLDGRERLESSLEVIQRTFQADEGHAVIDRILGIGKRLSSEDSKSLLVESLYRFFNSDSDLLRFYGELEDSFSMTTIIDNGNQRLNVINRRLHGGLGETE